MRTAGLAAAAGTAPLPRDFYLRPTLRVARDLLGCLLVHDGGEGATAGIIVEVEAYCGTRDRGCHTYGGRRTPRNEVMWGPGGHAYIYFTYGMHFCLNAVTREAGRPEAVLVRALEPVFGIDGMRRRRVGVDDRRLASGPGNVCRAMGIDRAANGFDLVSSSLRIVPGEPPAASRISRSARIGIAYAGEYAGRPWRFFVTGHPSVSGRSPRG
jgi:DNA-3-methyladenine glycosylase